MAYIDEAIGKSFGRLYVLAEFGDRQRVICRCSCGNKTAVVVYSLKYGNTRSCGCLVGDRNRSRTKHGKTKTIEYGSWDQLRSRCLSTKNSNYSNYGGRGISICERWDDFSNFLEDMGLKPSPEYTLDRIDNNGNYEPGNCRWATKIENANNKRNNRVIRIGSHIKNFIEWCRFYKISRSTVKTRLKAGWPEKEAFQNKRYEKPI